MQDLVAQLALVPWQASYEAVFEVLDGWRVVIDRGVLPSNCKSFRHGTTATSPLRDPFACLICI